MNEIGAGVFLVDNKINISPTAVRETVEWLGRWLYLRKGFREGDDPGPVEGVPT